MDFVRADELQIQENVMPDARSMIEQVLRGKTPAQVVEAISPDPIPLGPTVGAHSGARVPPNPEDPCFMYMTSFELGGEGPHAHIAMLDDQGNGTTDEEMKSQHAVLRFEVQPDPADGHTHSIDQGIRRDVPSSKEPAGQDTSFHLLTTDPNRFKY